MQSDPSILTIVGLGLATLNTIFLVILTLVKLLPQWKERKKNGNPGHSTVSTDFQLLRDQLQACKEHRDLALGGIRDDLQQIRNLLGALEGRVSSLERSLRY